MITQRIFLLGEFQTTPTLKFSGRNAQRLLVFLLLRPNRLHSRDRLAAELWPGQTLSHGRRALSDALYRLRQSIPSHWLNVESDRLSLIPSPGLWVDVWALRELAAQEDSHHLAEAAVLYRGDLVPELDEVWLRQPQEELWGMVTAVLHKLAKHSESERHFAQAQKYYSRLIEIDEMDEAAYQGVMRCLAGQKRLEEALSVYRELVRFLNQELHTAPAMDTQQLAQQLQAEWELQKQTLLQPTRTPFVGRVAERSRLLVRLDEAQTGRGGLLLLLGDAGIGKTRLLESLARSASWRGWQVAWGTSEEFALPVPYAPLAAALAMALPRPRLQQLLRLVPSWWISFMARVVPGLAAQIDLPALPDDSPLEKELPRAVQAVLAGLQQIAPHLLILDDVQWADPAIWPLLSALQSALRDLSILVVVSGRASALQKQPNAWAALQAWEQAGAMVLHLAGLDLPLLADLAQAMGRGDLTQDELSHLHRITGGNPLLVLSLLESQGPITAVSQPQLLALQRQQLAALADAALLGLQAAAVLGYRFDYELWEAVVTGIGEGELPVLAGELEQQRFLVLEPDSYRFSHDTLRASVYEAIPPARRILLHQRALVACAEYQPEATQSLLNHAVQGVVQTAVARYAHQAGQEALARFAYRDAVGHFSQVIDASVDCDEVMLYEALVGRARAYTLLAEPDLLEADLQQLQPLLARLTEAHYRVPVLKMRVERAWNRGAQAEAQHLAEEGLQLAQEIDDDSSEAVFLEMLARVARNRGDYRQAQAWIAQAYERYVAAGDRFGQASSLDKQANLAYEAGESEQAVEMHRQAAAIFRQLGAVPYESRALSGEALAQKALGNFAQARQTHQRVLEIAVAFGDRHSQWAQLVLLGNVAFELGDYETAVSWYEEALTVSRQTDNPRSLTMTLHNLGEAYRETAAWEKALDYYAEGLEINRAKGFERGEANILNGIGLAHLGLQQVSQARQAFSAALALWQAIGERFKQSETLAGLALVYLAEGKLPEAQAQLSAALKLLAVPNVHPFWRRWAHFAAYQLYGTMGERETAVAHLCHAAQAMTEITSQLPLAEQEKFLARVPINRQIQQALADHAQRQQVRLVKASVPLGQPLAESDYITITWTVAAPTDSTIASTAPRRRHVLQRLLNEAEAQGAAPTDADLAEALGVSRRTILRDMEALAAANITLPTRGRAG